MVITRKIEIYVHEEDKELKKNFQHTLYEWRDAVRRAANLIVSHKFVQQNVRDFMYLQEDVQERFMVTDEKTGVSKVKYNVSDTLKKEKGMSEQNTTYRLIASLLKGKVPADIYSCLNQAVAKTFKETVMDINKGEATLRSYKNNIPMPFSAKALSNIHKADDGRFYFTLFGIPFACMLGRDRSNNEAVIDRCISGEYKMCSSSIAFEKTVNRETGKKKQKLFLFLCVDIPKKEIELKADKKMFCYLSVDCPIQYTYEVQAKNVYDSGVKWASIGTAEEFQYRRLQIQAAMKRCQVNSRYSVGGKGRKRKLQALERFAEQEKNYVKTKLHTYSRMLVDKAIQNKCATIVLVNQSQREEQAKNDNQKGKPFVLRNWSYYGLKNLIKYKADMVGIKVIENGKSDDEEDTGNDD